MLITARSFATTQRPHSYKFTLVDKTVLSSARLLSVAQDAIFYYCTHAHTQSRSQTKDHSRWSGSKTSGHVKSRFGAVFSRSSCQGICRR